MDDLFNIFNIICDVIDQDYFNSDFLIDEEIDEINDFEDLFNCKGE